MINRALCIGYVHGIDDSVVLWKHRGAMNVVRCIVECDMCYKGMVVALVSSVQFFLIDWDCVQCLRHFGVRGLHI